MDRPSTASGKPGVSVCVQLGTLPSLPGTDLPAGNTQNGWAWTARDPAEMRPFFLLSSAGITGPSAEQMPRTCSGCAKRPAIWCATVRPARTTSPCPSSEWGLLAGGSRQDEPVRMSPRGISVRTTSRAGGVSSSLPGWRERHPL